MYKLNYPRHIGSMLKEKFEYLREFEPEIENVYGYELGAHMGSIHKKNQGPNILCYCTFKTSLRQTFSLDQKLLLPISFTEDFWVKVFEMVWADPSMAVMVSVKISSSTDPPEIYSRRASWSRWLVWLVATDWTTWCSDIDSLETNPSVVAKLNSKTSL